MGNPIKIPDRFSRSDWNEFINEYFTATKAGDYEITHKNRYLETLAWIPKSRHKAGRAVELGCTSLFMELLRNAFNYNEVHGTDFEIETKERSFYRELPTIGSENWYMIHQVNLEHESLPIADNYFDLVLACEIIEHMEIDPMYLIIEINRILAPGGKLLLTTPNSASSRALWSILNGYRPHFFMQYNKLRRLYKHNFEYDVSAISDLVSCGGFEIERITTKDCFAPTVEESLDVLRTSNFPVENRGDNIFILAKKVGAISNRFPDSVYY